MKGLISRGRFAGFSFLVLLSGCSMFQAAPTSPVGWTHWICDSQVVVDWKTSAASAQDVDVRLGGVDPVYHLKPEPGAEGALYSDGVLAFNNKGAEGLVYWVATNDLIGRGCKAP